jgi:hypothetical protein
MDMTFFRRLPRHRGKHGFGEQACLLLETLMIVTLLSLIAISYSLNLSNTTEN